MINKKLSRRDILKSTALCSTAWWVAGRSTIAESRSPNEKLNIACIGLGNQGKANLSFVATQNIVALCDVDSAVAGIQAARFPGARIFSDFRVMLDRMGREIDAVVITTPNHTHATIAMNAMRRGKHCYCEKPLAHTIYETREMNRVAREMGVVTQMGTQIHAEENYRRTVELIQSGAIGNVTKVHVWFGKPGGWRRYKHVIDRPNETPAIPGSLDWDSWIGPAPLRSFHPCYHPHDWHYWWDFGDGELGNMGCHFMDLVFWALNLQYPTAIESNGSELHPDSTPFEQECHWEFPARGSMPPVEIIWSHGNNTPQAVLDYGGPKWPAGILFIGEKGQLAADYSKRILLPQNEFAGFAAPEKMIPDAIGNHRMEWYEACKGNGKTLCHFDYAAPLTETILLGNLAFRAGEKIYWNAKEMKVTNSAIASDYVHYEYRKGWEL